MRDFMKLETIDLGSPVTVTAFRSDLGETVTVNLDYLISVEELHFLRRNHDFSSPSKIVEVGAGFGRTAHVLLELNPEIQKYRIVDLPETLKLSKSFLAEVLSVANFRKLEFVDASQQDTAPVSSWDLFIQIDGFQEMTEATIAHYYNTLIEKSDAVYVSNPIGKYPPELAGVQGLDLAGYEATRKLGRSTFEIDPWGDVSLSSARAKHNEAYRPRQMKLVDTLASFLRPHFTHALYRRQNPNPGKTVFSSKETE